MGSDLANELRSIVEQVTDPIAALEELKPRLRGLIRGMDNFMQAAQDVTNAAEQSDYSKVATYNAVKRWESKIGQVYADFKSVNETLQEVIGKGLRRHSGKGKSLAQRKAKGSKDYSGVAAEDLKKQIAGIVKTLSGDIHQVADDGAFLLQQIDRITGYKNPSEKTVEEELAALWQDFVDFRESFGAKVWAPLTGLLKRLDAISTTITKYGPDVEKEMNKPAAPKPTGLAAAWGAWSEMESIGASACLSDKQKAFLAEAMERDQRRGVGKYGLAEQKEKEEPGFKGEPSAGGADKMAAKGYKFKILLKQGPPLYAKTEKGAKEVQKDYPGSKIVANEAIDGEITDAALIAEAGDTLLSSVLPDFDALLEGDDERPFELLGEAAELVMEGLKSRKLLYTDLLDINEKGIAKLKRVPSSPSAMPNEVYGKVAMIYVSWVSPDDRKTGEAELKKRGYKIERYDVPSVSSVQVSYFKGVGWSEDIEGEASLAEEETWEKTLRKEKEDRSKKDAEREIAQHIAGKLSGRGTGEKRPKGKPGDTRKARHLAHMKAKKDARRQAKLKPGEKMVFGTARKVLGGRARKVTAGIDYTSNLTENEIGKTIIQQMGGLNRIQAMLGATVLWLPKGVGIKWPSKQPSKGNYVEIILTPDDLYDMTFYNIRGAGKNEVQQFNGLYADALVKTFEGQTGWYLRL